MGEALHAWGQGFVIQEFSVPFSQFCCELSTTLKCSINKKKKERKQNNQHSVK